MTTTMEIPTTMDSLGSIYNKVLILSKIYMYMPVPPSQPSDQRSKRVRHLISAFLHYNKFSDSFLKTGTDSCFQNNLFIRLLEMKKLKKNILK